MGVDDSVNYANMIAAMAAKQRADAVPSGYVDGADLSADALTTIASASALAGTYARLGALDGEAVLPLTIPTYDGDSSVVHCDVHLIQAGFGPQKFRYWMGFTPYPGALREQPSVCASYDGVNWVIPTGAPNPVVPQTEITAAGFLYGSDPDLGLLADGTTLAMYYRLYRDDGSPKQRIYRKTTTDGVTWSAAVQCVDVPSISDSALSPTVVYDGTNYKMWTVNHPAATMNQRVEYRTSADGITWSAASSCTIPLNADPWHLDVVYAGGIYHMLLDILDSGNATRLIYLKSSDGITWTGRSATMSSNDRAVPLSGFAFDAGGRHYRSSMIPVIGPNGINWDVYVSGLPVSFRTGNGPASNPVGADTGNPWRFGLFRGMTLPAPIPSAPSMVIPPGSTIRDYAMTAWFTANDALFSRFQLQVPTVVRYVDFAVGTSSGNIQVGYVRLRGTDHKSFDRLKTSGTIACPSTGAVRYDLGAETLEPGDYAVFLWCDNTTATFPLNTSSGGGWMAAAKMTGSYSNAIGIPASDVLAAWTNRCIGVVLEGDN